MSASQTITRERFLTRLVELCVRSGIRDLPKDETDQHILFKSAALTLAGPEPWTEAVVNEKLKHWLQLSGLRRLDHVKLRRYLVEAGYLTRTPDGAEYRSSPDAWGQFAFEPSVEQIDIAAELAAARADVERRKQEYLRKTSAPD